jgi:serine/threonine protein kinase
LKYEVRKLIGKGGHAFVYDCFDPFLGRPVALKVIPPRPVGRSLARRAREEARLLVRMNHDGIVKVYDAGGTDEGLIYLVMERLVGRSLRDALRELGRLTAAEALQVALQVADAVELAHRDGVIHRDLKPENVFVQPGNRLKVHDFGIAKVLGAAGSTTRKDRLPGTLLYMAPEQLRGFPASAQSDVFSLGTLLYESLYRHPALLGPEEPTFELIGRRQIELLPPLLSDVDPTLPRHVARFVQRALMKHPDQRFQSMGELAAAAKAALGRLEADNGGLRLRELSGPGGEEERTLESPLRPLERTTSPVATPIARSTVEGRSWWPRSRFARVITVAAPLGFLGGTLFGHGLWTRSLRAPVPAVAKELASPADSGPGHSRQSATTSLEAHARAAGAAESAAAAGTPPPVTAGHAAPQAGATGARSGGRVAKKPAVSRAAVPPAAVPRPGPSAALDAGTARATPGAKAMEERLEWLRRDLGVETRGVEPPPATKEEPKRPSDVQWSL